ncbi:hypothetical protein R3W88_015082 [Solanum pinnatisectum]|uniref:Uncharacterized protein n=1 Tax=Solanum pinnatisectum TaxID=50273 RepID=A0AAV9KTU0_9SOLN|nr:hypothetical protein R3W88_015082 [Solanum pinnatisectum]
MSYFELKDYIRELGYSTTWTFSIKAPNSGILVNVDNDKDILDMICSLEDRDEVEVFVRHLVDEAIVGPMLIENGSNVDMGEFDSATDDDIDVGPVGPDFSEEKVKSSDYSTEDSIESKAELVGDDDEE